MVALVIFDRMRGDIIVLQDYSTEETFDHRGYWIRNTDKNNTELNGARLKACLSKISNTKKYLCIVMTLFSFGAILSIFVKFFLIFVKFCS